MTTTDLPSAAPGQFDTGPLSWVMVEIREALSRSRIALFEAGGRAAEDQATQLQHAKSHLHQAHGALQIVEVDGVGLITQVAEEALDRFKSGTLKCSTDHAQVLARLYQALVEYLEELLEGAPSQPVRLFPYYRAVQEMLGAERIHPADLFYPDLAVLPGMPLAEPVAPADYTAYRQRFEKALLPFLKSTDAQAQTTHASALLDAVALVADAQQDARARTFWLAMRSFAQLVASGQLSSGLYVKQLFGLMNLQIRRLSQGSAIPPDGMLRDALFFIATVDPAPPGALQLRQAFALNGLAASDYELERYGQIDMEVLALAKDGMTQAKASWTRLASAEIDPQLDADFARALILAADASEQLGVAALGTLLRQLADVAGTAVSAGRSEALALEIASALLFAEHGLEQLRHLPDEFAAHADTLGARLQALVVGQTPPAAPQWQGGLVRQMQQDDTVLALAMEMKTGLRQVEKVLDEYYAEPSKRPSLRALDVVLHQLQGALAVLDQDDAVRAALHVKAAVHELAAGTGDPAHEPKALDDIAQNVGALGFFVDMLAQNPAGARERFVFDEEHGTFRSVPFRKMAGAESIPLLEEQVAPPVTPQPPAVVVSDDAVEAELLDIFIAEAQEVLDFVVATLAEPDGAAGSPDNLTMLRRSFHTLKGSGRMVGLNQFADAAASVERTMNVWLAELRPASSALFELLDYAAQDLRAWVAELVATGVSDRSAAALVATAARVQDGAPFEMETLADVVEAPPVPADAPQSASEVPVALASPEDAWSAAVQASAAANADAAAPYHETDFERTQGPGFDTAIDEAADAAELYDGAAPPEPLAQEAGAAVTEAVAEEVAEEVTEEVAQEVTEDSTEDAAAELLAGPEAIEASDVVADEARHGALAGNVIEFPSVTAPLVPRDDNLKHIGELEIPLPLYNIYLAETDELVRLLARDFSEWRHEPRRPVSNEALQAAHTLAGTSGTVGFKLLREVALALELTLQALLPPAPHLDQVQHDLLDFTVERIRQMLQSFAQGDMPAAQPELISALQDLRTHLAATLPAASNEIETRLDTLLAETLGNIADAAIPPEPQYAPVAAPAHGQESAQEQLFRELYNMLSGSIPESQVAEASVKPVKAISAGSDNIDDLFDAAFDDAFAEPPLVQVAPVLEPAAPASVELDSAVQASEAAETAESPVEQYLAPHAATESSTVPVPEPEAVASPEAELGGELQAELEAELQAEPQVGGAAESLLKQEQRLVPDPLAIADQAAFELDAQVIPLAPAESDVLAAAPAIFHDELDADLLPVFLEEGADLLPQVGQALRAWQHDPSHVAQAQSLLRMLHTLKGSARMAGAMRLGQHAHEIETHIENMVHAGIATPHAFDELMAHYDHAQLLFEQLQHPVLEPMPGADGESAAGDDGVVKPASAWMDHAATSEEEPALAKTPLVRVRADILDRLVNQAGEVSISRSKLENEVDALRSSLFDFSENLTRLRRQLREVEMQAESQIASRMSISSEREFDPLEFDRFTRLQELTRMMAESVNDVASFHESLSRSVDSAGADLVLQARMTRDLQRDLMRVRMVPFASISERLFRVARQSAKEVDKRVNLDIRGSAVEVDRSVLERMAAPFEHLLRNAIAHGIEPRAQRSAAGKEETGELLVQVSQQGNEVVIEFSDDGAGLDLERIRTKARSVGLLGAEEDIADSEAADLIFEPGFSTADALTELSGRGVGMDVVQSEAQSLGGRIDMYTERGKGARFTIRLPLTLAVTQVVLLTAGGKTYAMPSILVEQVLQMKEGALAEAYLHGKVALHGHQAGLHYLPALLGERVERPQAHRSSPVLMLCSGHERLAVQVDEVLGNREVVIKNIGPQLARMAGIAGATVLGSGDIVLILNPVALAQHLAHHPQLQPQYAALADTSPSVRAHQRSIMVVDDSLTVRRVMQRLLEREGYLVVLAKDGVDALEQLQAMEPDLMLVDIEMPRMDGFDLTRNVRSDQRTSDIPIVMITSRSADKHRNYALQLGVNAYFGKPFQEPLLLEAIQGLLEDQRPQADALTMA